MRIDEALNWAKAQFVESDTALLDAQVLLAFVLGKETIYLMTWPERVLHNTQLESFKSLVKKRCQGHPIAHLTGTREFWSLPLKVNSSTLIPRPDTEVLVEVALEKVKQNAHILDLGTGTGAIILALASELKSANCVGVDYSHDTVSLANQNLQSLHLNNVQIIQSDWFSNVQGRFDLIVSNPPYIDEDDIHLKQGDVRFEPLSALVAKDNGLADIRHITQQARTFLNIDGYLMFEHGFDQAKQVQGILADSGYRNIQSVQDYAGNDRVTFAQWGN